jgi:iron-sulfur cluster assembly accessory protein
MSTIAVTDALQSRVAAERARREPALYLRVLVDAGGCSGFEYQFSWVLAAEVTADDTVYDGAVVIDDVSAPYLAGATIDFEQTLMGENFRVINPQATASCGCGNSFAV